MSPLRHDLIKVLKTTSCIFILVVMAVHLSSCATQFMSNESEFDSTTPQIYT